MPDASNGSGERRWWLPAALLLVFPAAGCDRNGTAGGPAAGPAPGPAQDVWELAARDGVDFRATGNEPGWVLEIREQESLLLMADYGTSRYEIASPEPQIDEISGGRLFRQPGAPETFEVILIDRPCRDDMSGEPFPTTVSIELGERRLRGCGRSLRSPE